jgi:hypothetical protein
MSDGWSYGGPKRQRSRFVRNVFPTSDEIAERAYELLVADGKRAVRAFEYWRRAEDELLDAAATRALLKTR